MKISVVNKNGKSREYRVSKHVKKYYESEIARLQRELQTAQAALRESLERAHKKFNAFAELVFSPVKSTVKVTNTRKEITFENGQKIRYQQKHPDIMRWHND